MAVRQQHSGLLPLGLKQILLPLAVGQSALQLPDRFPRLLDQGLRGKEGILSQNALVVFAQLFHYLFVGHLRHVPFKEIASLVPKHLNEIQGIEHRQKEVAFRKDGIQVLCRNGLSIPEDICVVADPVPDQAVGLPFAVHNLKLNTDVFAWGAEPIHPVAAEKGHSGDGVGNRVRNGAFPLGIVAENCVHGTKRKAAFFRKAFEARYLQG